MKQKSEKNGNTYLKTGKVIIKFQTKEIIPVYVGTPDLQPPFENIKLEDELAPGEHVRIIYDILRYTKKNTSATEHALSFKPTAVFYFPKKGEECNW